MDDKILNAVCKQVYDTYPDFRGIRPKLKLQENPNLAKTPGKTYLLTFQTSVMTANNQKLPKYVRVTVNEQGKILKTSLSR